MVIGTFLATKIFNYEDELSRCFLSVYSRTSCLELFLVLNIYWSRVSFVKAFLHSLKSFSTRIDVVW